VAALEAATPAPAPAPHLNPSPDPGSFTGNADATTTLTRSFTPGDAVGLGHSFDQIATTDHLGTSAGTRPAVPQQGNTDPTRVEAQQTAARDQSASLQTAAHDAVLNGPGPEQAQLRSLQESFTPAPTAAPVLEAPTAPAGATAFAAQPLDSETLAVFDQYHAEPMRAALEPARAQVDQATANRDTERSTELARAEAEQNRLNAEADTAQRDQVTARRADIQSARQTAVDDQTAHVADLGAEADTARGTARAKIDSQITTTETAVADSFAVAETEAQTQVTTANTAAETKRSTAEAEAESASWWDRAVDWVADQFHRLAAAITAIFDAVRAAVKDIIDRVKAEALRLIDRAAAAIRSAIEAYGALLRAAVNALLVEHFPAIAAALTAAIDGAVAAAIAAVDAVASVLKAGISLLLDALAAGLDAILAAYQSAVNAALALVQLALTGDWGALARLILTPILNLLGIPPDAFFQMIAHAVEAADLIIANPMAFVANLLDTVTGGIRLFADNFPRHLLIGILTWLTGPLGAGIIMPQQFDLWGLLDIGRQVFGLTTDMLRRVATRVLGPEAVARIEFVMNYITALITGGWRGLWDQLMSDLGSLRDMVLDQIQTFLMEKVVMAAITWFASMFSPVGALVKLVQTIWNFIQFLRSQLSRIFQVVETVITSIWQIATGALDVPMRGVESVLGRLVPVVLDLLARLIGVPGIPEKVQEVLGRVRTRIETGIENLMRRVAGALGVGTVGGPAAASGDIMAPIQFTSGGESHTILIEDEGDTVRPIIRSTPTPLATWLDGRMGTPFEDLAREKSWTGTDLQNKREQAVGLVEAAKAEESQLDAKAEETEDKKNSAAAPTASDAVKTQAQTAVQQTQMQGETTKNAIAQVLKFWGIATMPLNQKFAAEIANIPQPLQANFTRYVLPDLDPAVYAVLTWDQLTVQVMSGGQLTEPWRRPANTSGVGRRFIKDDDFTNAIVAEAKRAAKAEKLPDATTFLGEPTTNADEVKRFFSDYLAERLNASPFAGTIVRQFLRGPVDFTALAEKDLAVPIKAAATAMCTPGTGPDSDIRTQITGSTYFAIFEDAAQAGTRVFNYYAQQNPDGSPAGEGVPHPLVWFLQKDGSSRNGANREKVSDAIRAAKHGMNEWIPASIGYAAIKATADSFKTRGDLDAPSGIANFVEFQNRVRTPTTNLVFQPNSFAEVENAKLPYVSRLHHESRKPYASLTPEERNQFYPKTGPDFASNVQVLQAHAGGLRARQDKTREDKSGAEKDAPLDWTYAQNASPRWHIDLTEGIVSETPVSTNVEMRTMREVRQFILKFYDRTIWSGKRDLDRTEFDVYQLSGGAGSDLTYQGLKERSASTFQQSLSELVVAMKDVLDR
jgi:hypothetical protein